MAFIAAEPDIASWEPDACLHYAGRFFEKARGHYDRGEFEPAAKRASEAAAELQSFAAAIEKGDAR
jgi:hypothetical protein